MLRIEIIWVCLDTGNEKSKHLNSSICWIVFTCCGPYIQKIYLPCPGLKTISQITFYSFVKTLILALNLDSTKMTQSFIDQLFAFLTSSDRDGGRSKLVKVTLQSLQPTPCRWLSAYCFKNKIRHLYHLCKNDLMATSCNFRSGKPRKANGYNIRFIDQRSFDGHY